VVACLLVALADMFGCVWSLSRVGVSFVARVCLCLASPLLCLALGLASASLPFGPHAVRRVPRPSVYYHILVTAVSAPSLSLGHAIQLMHGSTG
jgi:hypothetical protein